MKNTTSFLKRCLALALALVLLVSNVNLGVALKANAAEVSVSEAAIVAGNYGLTVAEKALLESGYLTSGEVSYTKPTDNDGLVAVDTENAKITAQSKDGWVATKAVIVYGGNELEVALVNGEGSYDPAVVGNAFSVKVTYSLDVEVENQQALFEAMAALKKVYANGESVAAQSGKLFILEEAMPALVELANKKIAIGNTGSTAGMNDEGKAGVNAMNAQMSANNGKLLLSSDIAEYENAEGSKVKYLLENGTDMRDHAAELAGNLGEVSKALNTLADNINTFIQFGFVDEAVGKQIETVSDVVEDLLNGLKALPADGWIEADNDLPIAKADKGLDALVADLGALSSVEVKNPLHVATATVQANLAMWNVNVKVVLNKVNEENVCVEYGSESVMLTLADGATAEEVQAEIDKSGIVADAIAAWGEAYVEDKYEVNVPELPATLTADLDYVITYSPKTYTVIIAGEETQALYGTKIILPVHENPAKSYDYKADGVYYPQGSEVIVEDNITFTREEGKAYSTGNLYEIVADNYGTDKIAAILNSGAVKGNEAISYREPSKAELEELVKLEGNKLTVQSYPSSYAGLNWAPYSYVVDGNTKYFDGADEVTIAGDFETVNVYYRLTLANHTEAEIKELLDLTAALVDEAEGQKSVMDRLAGYKSQMSQLNKNMLNGLNGMIGGYAVSGGGSFSDALVDEMKATITSIINNSCAADGSLKLNGIIDGYTDPNNGGLIYYYQNADYIKGQITDLSDKLEALLGDPQGKELISTLLTDMNYGDYVEKLDDLNAKMAAIKADLAPVNENIDTANAAKLSALAKALTMEGSVAYEKCGSPYIEMGPVIRTADKYVTIEVKVNADGKTNSNAIAVTIMKGEALSQNQVNELKAAVVSFVDGTIETAYYNNNYNNGAELNALVGVALTEGATYNYEWTAKTYTVKIEGEADQTVTVKNLTVELPAHPQAANGMSYEYTVGDKTANSGIFTFEKEDLLNKFVGGEFTITRIEKNASVEALVKMVNTINADMGFEALTLVEKNGVYTGINANIAAGDMMNLMMGLVMKSGYGYIGLNNEGFIYSNDKAELELSIQTLINAILNDNGFNNNTVIALGENGKGKVMTASMQLGASAAELQYSNLTFTLNLKSVPAQLTNNVGTIKTVSNYLKFQSDNGTLNVEVNLPDQVYGAYAAALIATGNVDKSDAAAIDQAVAMQFLYDYLTAITGSEMDMVTFTNTLKKLGVNKDLTGYNNYYTKGIKAYNEWVKINITSDGAAIDATVPGQTAINGLLKVAGIDQASMSTYLGMLKEYKADGEIKASIQGTLANAGKNYKALIVDAQAAGVANKFEAPSSYDALYKEAAELAGYSAVILLDDVDEGGLYFGGTTILDLNGKDVAGIIGGDNLIIIDSSMDTYKAGSAYGVSDNVIVLAGNYATDVKSFLKDGYYMDGTTVRNALYHITDEEGTVTFVINGDVYESEYVDGYIPNAKALAIDIASDLALNYALSASLSVGGNELIAIDIDDLVGLYAGDTVNGLIKELVDCVTIGEEGYENNKGFEAVVNMILEDVLDFGAISEALANGTALATYDVALNPWQIEIDHVKDGNYATINVTNNAELAKEFKVALVVESKYNAKLAKLAKELDKIVTDETEVVVDIPQPSYSNKELTVAAAGKANAVVDMSKNSDYATMIGVILAYGNSGKRAAVKEAINNNDMDALKAVIDNTSVKEVFTALKKLSRNVGYAKMAETVGVEATASAVELEGLYHIFLCAAGKALEKLDITGMDSKLGALYNEETGYYELSKENIFRDKELSARGYSALIELTATELSLKVKLFADAECLWGDADHDGDVDQHDASLVFEYFMNDGNIDQEFCLIRTDVDQDGDIDQHDASIIFEYFMEDKTNELPESAN